MSIVFPLPIPASQKLVLLALCDRADDDGGSLFPSIANIARKASLSERQTQRMMAELIDATVVEVIKNEKGGRGVTRHYLLHIDRVHMLIKGDIESPNEERVTTETQKGDTGDAKRVTSASPDSSMIHQVATSGLAVNKNGEEKKGGQDVDVWDQEVLPSRWHDYAEAKGIPDEQIYVSWRRFKDVSEFPWRREKWQSWIDREKVRGRQRDDY